MSNGTFSVGRGPRREPGKEKFWRTALANFAASGQSVRGFCRERQLSEASFYAWRRILARRYASGSTTTPEGQDAPAFVPIRLAETTCAPIEIVLAGGHCIRLSCPIDRAALAEIVAALESAPVAPQPAEA